MLLLLSHQFISFTWNLNICYIYMCMCILYICMLLFIAVGWEDVPGISFGDR